MLVSLITQQWRNFLDILSKNVQRSNNRMQHSSQRIKETATHEKMELSATANSVVTRCAE